MFQILGFLVSSREDTPPISLNTIFEYSSFAEAAVTSPRMNRSSIIKRDSESGQGQSDPCTICAEKATGVGEESSPDCRLKIK